MTHYLEAAQELRPNEKQWLAYESPGNCVVLAGPGSGKTKLLTIKIARLLDEEICRPRGLACVTYSTECVRELRRRLAVLGVDNAPGLFLGTLHAFCLQHVLLPHGALAGLALPKPLRIAGPRAQKEVLAKALVAARIGSSRSIGTDLDRFRADNLDRDQWSTADDIARLAIEYEKALAARGLIDFAQMTREAVNLVATRAWVRDCLRAKFPILVVDEYQDLGAALHRLVLALCFRAGARLFAVGDPDQSIYGFVGAHPEHLNSLAERIDVSAVRLTVNYRSGTRIVAAAKAAIATGVEYEANSKKPGLVLYPGCVGGIAGEAAHLATTLLPDILKRWSPGDVLIAFRSRTEAEHVEAALAAQGYEYVKVGSSAAYPKAPLTRFVEEVARWCAGGFKSGDPRLSRVLKQWITLQGIVNDDELARTERLRLVRFMFGNRDENALARAWLAKFDVDVLQPGDARARLMATGDVEPFDELLAVVKAGARLESFTVRNLAGQAGSREHLNLITLHSAKGSEFPVVVLVGADEGSFPWATARPGSSQESEARRLFYVGVSRAQHELYILWSQPVEGDWAFQGPSRFLREIHAKLAST